MDIEGNAQERIKEELGKEDKLDVERNLMREE